MIFVFLALWNSASDIESYGSGCHYPDVLTYDYSPDRRFVLLVRRAFCEHTFLTILYKYLVLVPQFSGAKAEEIAGYDHYNDDVEGIVVKWVTNNHVLLFVDYPRWLNFVKHRSNGVTIELGWDPRKEPP